VHDGTPQGPPGGTSPVIADRGIIDRGIIFTAVAFGQYRWAAQQLSEMLGKWATEHPEPHTSALLATHGHQHAEHASAFAARVPWVGGLAVDDVTAPLAEVAHLLARARSAGDTAAFVHRVYEEALPALEGVYRRHLAATDPRVDGPTARVLTLAARDLAEQQAAATLVLTP
jgi:hypothetical protein